MEFLNVYLFNPVCIRMCTLHNTHVEVRGGQLAGVGSLGHSGESQGLNSDHQCWAASPSTVGAILVTVDGVLFKF